MLLFKIKKNISVICAFFSALNPFFYYLLLAQIYSSSVNAKNENQVYETKLDLNQDNIADVITYKQTHNKTLSTISVKIKNRLVDTIEVIKDDGKIHSAALYQIKGSQYRLVYNYSTKDKVFFQSLDPSSKTEGDMPCVYCELPNPTKPLTDTNNMLALTGITSVLNPAEMMKQKFPLGASCKTKPNATNKRGSPELDFETVFYEQIIKLTEDKKIQECLASSSPALGVGFSDLPNTLFKTSAPQIPVNFECVDNSDNCECSPKLDATATDVKICQDGKCLPKRMTARYENSGLKCDQDNYNKIDCKKLITVGAYVAGNGKRTIMLSNTLRVHNHKMAKPERLQKDKEALKETLAHEMIHAFGCLDEELTDCLVSECVSKGLQKSTCSLKKEENPNDVPPELIADSRNSDIRTLALEQTTVAFSTTENQLGKRGKNSPLDLSKSRTPTEQNSPSPATEETPQKAAPTTPQDIENSDLGNTPPPVLNTPPIAAAPQDTQMPSDSRETSSGSRIATRIISPEKDSLYRSVASAVTKAFNPLPKAQADNSPAKKIGNYYEPSSARAATPTSSTQRRPASKEARTQTALSAEAAGLSSSTQASSDSPETPKIDTARAAQDKPSQTTVTNITKTTNITNISGSAATSSAAPSLAAAAPTRAASTPQSSKPASSTERAKEVLRDFKVSPNPEPITGSLYRQVKRELDTDSLRQFLNSQGIQIINPDVGTSFGSTKPSVIIIDKGDRFTKKVKGK